MANTTTATNFLDGGDSMVTVKIAFLADIEVPGLCISQHPELVARVVSSAEGKTLALESGSAAAAHALLTFLLTGEYKDTAEVEEEEIDYVGYDGKDELAFNRALDAYLAGVDNHLAMLARLALAELSRLGAQLPFERVMEIMQRSDLTFGGDHRDLMVTLAHRAAQPIRVEELNENLGGYQSFLEQDGSPYVALVFQVLSQRTMLREILRIQG